MRQYKYVMILVCSVFVGCSNLVSIKNEVAVNKPSKVTPYCESNDTLTLFSEYCKLTFWITQLEHASTMSWHDRTTFINTLSESPKDTLTKILYSQQSDTPYQNRLRAQSWVNSLQRVADKPMNSLLNVIIYEPSQHRLELESAISMLSKINSQQSSAIEAQKREMEEVSDELDKQQQQMEQLLHIEQDMVNQIRIEK